MYSIYYLRKPVFVISPIQKYIQYAVTKIYFYNFVNRYCFSLNLLLFFLSYPASVLFFSFFLFLIVSFITYKTQNPILFCLSLPCFFNSFSSLFGSTKSTYSFSPARLIRLAYPECIEWFVDGQAFLRSYYSAPPPPPYPLSSHQVVSLSQSSCVSPGRSYTDGRGRGRGANPYDLEKSLALYKPFNTLWAYLWM